MESEGAPPCGLRAKGKADFSVHFAVYLAVNAFLVVTWRATGAGFPWFVFPLFGWGIGIAAHFMEAVTSDEQSIYISGAISRWE